MSRESEAGRVRRRVFKCEEREEAGAQRQWRFLLFLVTHSLVTSKAGRQRVLVGRKPP